MKMILTSECEQCRYGTVDETDKARIKIICSFKGKQYYLGQRVPCDSRTKKEEKNSDKENSSEKDGRI